MKTSLFNLTILAITSMFVIAACTTNTQKENTAIGAVAGAVLGGAAGSAIGSGTGQLIAMGVGAVAGGLLGGAIGNNMESSDSRKMNNTLDHNDTRKTSKWTNKNSHIQYSMTPMSAHMAYKGYENCRKFYGTITADGKMQTVNGMACKQDDGTWKAV